MPSQEIGERDLGLFHSGNRENCIDDHCWERDKCTVSIILKGVSWMEPAIAGVGAVDCSVSH